MKVILIQPSKKSVTNVDVENELDPMQKLVGGYLEGHRLPNGDMLLVDENWHFNRSHNGVFFYNRQIWGGRGVIVGIRGSSWTKPKSTIKSVKQLISF